MQLQHPTLTEFVLESEAEIEASGEFSNILLELGVIGKIISREMNRAGLVSILGDADAGNASGDEVKKLDLLANDLMKKYLQQGANFCALASEEEEDIVVMDNALDSEYVIAFDPLDGSSNIDYNVSVGTIFSIHRRVTATGTQPELKDFLQPGHTQLAAGYIIYGSSTMMVYTAGNGVHGFTLDQSIGEWLLSHERILIPESCATYSANEAYVDGWDTASRTFLENFKSEQEKPSCRHIGSLVADIHRNLLKGGIHLRPYDNFAQQKAKLRLNYETKPIAMIIEQAGGYSTDGTRNILNIVPEELHQKAPFIAGNKEVAHAYESAYREAHS